MSALLSLPGIARRCFHLGDLLFVPQVVQRDVKKPLVGIQSLEDRKRMLRIVFFQRKLRVLNKPDGLGARFFEPANHLGLGETSLFQLFPPKTP